jgi:hypothetical protein
MSKNIITTGASSGFGVDTTIIVPGAFPTGTNHYVGTGHPADGRSACTSTPCTTPRKRSSISATASRQTFTGASDSTTSLAPPSLRKRGGLNE